MLGAVGLLIAAGLLQTLGDFPILTRTGLAQLLRQSAWQQALAGLPEQAWPWAETPAVSDTKVPRLGLSAAIVTEDDDDSILEPSQPAAGEERREPRTKLSEVGVGDSITVTTADGASRVYKITGRRVVDPHLAESDSELPGDATLVTCLPLDPLLASSLRLVIQATKVDPPAPPEPRPEQKL
jgi:hypothetical protein